MAENRSTDSKSAKAAKSTGNNRATNAKDCHCGDEKTGSKNSKKTGK